MAVEYIQSLQNPQVKQWLKLHSRKGRLESGRFLVEGIHLVEEAIRSSAHVEALLYDSAKGLSPSIQLALAEQGKDVKLIEVTEPIIGKLSDTQSPQGIIAVIKQLDWEWTSWWKQRSGNPFLLLLLDELQDPGNLGTILRTAEAAGVDGVVLGAGSVDLYNAKVVRATMGSLFRLPIFSLPLTQAAEEVLAADGQLLVTSLGEKSSPYDAPLYREKVAIVIGNEARGVSAELFSLASNYVHIPLYGPVESLNAAVASGIILYEAKRQQRRGQS